MNTETEKEAVHEFWNENSCGEQLYLKSEDQKGYAHQLEERYRLEPYIPAFAEFSTSSGKHVLEVGVGWEQTISRLLRRALSCTELI